MHLHIGSLHYCSSIVDRLLTFGRALTIAVDPSNFRTLDMVEQASPAKRPAPHGMKHFKLKLALSR